MNDLSRYHRQMILPGIGESGQHRLAKAHAIIVGVGALGSATAEFLARAGVGTLTLIDRDVVEPTNLQRQCLYAERDLGTPKVEAAARRLTEINSAVSIRPIAADFGPSSAERMLGWPAKALLADAQGSLLIDGTDNFDTRYLLNDLAIKHRVPYLYGGVVATRGMRFTVLPGTGPCLRCIFPDAPAPGTQPTCDTAGVLGPAVAMIAAGQASDAIRLILGHPIPSTLTTFDLWSGLHQTIDIARDPACVCCARGRFDYLDARLGTRAVWLCGQNSVQIFPDRSKPLDDEDDTPEVVDLAALAERLKAHAGPQGVTHTRFMTRATLITERADDGGPVHLGVFADGRAVIRGVRSPERARALYDRYVGG
jgi:adenylyltransferase/sulfurtransferase